MANYKNGMFKEITPIGSGYFADVFKGFDEKNNKTVVIKKLKDEFLSNCDYKERFKSEIEITMNLTNIPNIIEIFDYDLDDYWYLMEYCDYNLYDYIIKYKDKISFSDKLDIFKEILLTIKEIHSNDIIHRDISDRNILIKNTDSRNQLKLCDFGLGKDIYESKYETKSIINGYGTDFYVSPEQQLCLKNATKASDIFSLGKLLYFLITRKNKNLVLQEKNEINNLIKIMIDDDFNKRPTIEEVIENINNIIQINQNSELS